MNNGVDLVFTGDVAQTVSPDIAFIKRKGFSGEGLHAVRCFGFGVVIAVGNNDSAACRLHLQSGMAADISAATSN